MNPTRLLLVDDDAQFRASYKELLTADGFEVSEAGSADAAIEAFKRCPSALVVLDLMLPPTQRSEEGERVLAAILQSHPGTKVIVVSGAGDTRLPISLVRKGAHDFLTKPVDPDVLSVVLGRARERVALEARMAELEAELLHASQLQTGAGLGLLGNAPLFSAAKALVERAACTELPVLLLGETGTGKDVMARYVHAQSRRDKAAFVAINCGALSEPLLEATLFGHKRGAFTGAVSDAAGLFAEADGGTLFLDEVGDMPSALQVKLLRVLECGEIRPVGDTKVKTVDVRIISATHKPLVELVTTGAFREDLYWRLRGIEVTLPPLRERIGDLPVLCAKFLADARLLIPGATESTLGIDALRMLENHPFPGNLRELKNELQRARVMAGARIELQPDDFSPNLQATLRKPLATMLTSTTTDIEEGLSLEQKIQRLEDRELRQALLACEGNRSKAAQRLGLSRQGLLNKMARLGIA